MGGHEFIKRYFDSLGGNEFIKRQYGSSDSLKRGFGSFDSLGGHEFIKRFYNFIKNYKPAEENEIDEENQDKGQLHGINMVDENEMNRK